MREYYEEDFRLERFPWLFCTGSCPPRCHHRCVHSSVRTSLSGLKAEMSGASFLLFFSPSCFR